MKTIGLRAVVAALSGIMMWSALASAQVRQTALYIDDGNGNFTVINGAHNGGTYAFPTGGGTLVTSSSGTETLGATGSQNGAISLNSSTAATQTTTIQAGAATDAVTYVLPTTHPTANQVLTATSVTGSGPYSAQLGWGSGSSSAQMITGLSIFGGTGGTFTYPVGSSMESTTPSASVSDGDVIVVNRAGTVKNLTISIGGVPNSGSYIFTIYKNGLSTALTLTFSSSTAATLTDATHSFGVAIGDLLSIHYAGSGGPPTTNAAWAFDIQ